jgi:hypothetical protein
MKWPWYKQLIWWIDDWVSYPFEWFGVKMHERGIRRDDNHYWRDKGIVPEVGRRRQREKFLADHHAFMADLQERIAKMKAIANRSVDLSND